MRITCTDGGEDNSPDHATYHEDQVHFGTDLPISGRFILSFHCLDFNFLKHVFCALMRSRVNVKNRTLVYEVCYIYIPFLKLIKASIIFGD